MDRQEYPSSVMSAARVQHLVSSSVYFQQAMAAMNQDDIGSDDEDDQNYWNEEDSTASDGNQQGAQFSGKSGETSPSNDKSQNDTHHPVSELLSRRASEPMIGTKPDASLDVPHQSRRRKSIVQWADENNEALVREHPRKRYERKPSLKSEPPKPILKQS